MNLYYNALADINVTGHNFFSVGLEPKIPEGPADYLPVNLGSNTKASDLELNLYRNGTKIVLK